jgi:peptidoglycan/LPS O-acetylase OafA/YrhL
VAFFRVSGLLIPNSLKDDRPDPDRGFFVRRFFRVFRAYWLGSHNELFVRFPVSCAAATVLFIAMTPVAKVRWRPLAWVGLISYLLYLPHPAVLYLMAYVFERHGPGADLPVGAQMLLGATFSIGLAALAFHAVEKPAIALGARPTRRATARLLPDAC